jgi:hypothetical protein
VSSRRVWIRGTGERHAYLGTPPYWPVRLCPPCFTSLRELITPLIPPFLREHTSHSTVCAARSTGRVPGRNQAGNDPTLSTSGLAEHAWALTLLRLARESCCSVKCTYTAVCATYGACTSHDNVTRLHSTKSICGRVFLLSQGPLRRRPDAVYQQCCRSDGELG